MLSKLWKSVLLMGMLCLSLLMVSTSQAQETTNYAETFEEFVNLIQEKKEADQALTLADVEEYWGTDYDYVPHTDGVDGELLVNLSVNDGGSYLYFYAYPNDELELIDAYVLAQDASEPLPEPRDPVEFQDWMEEFIQQDLDDPQSLSQDSELQFISYFAYSSGEVDLQYVYDYFAYLYMLEEDKLSFYTFRHLNDEEPAEEITEDQANQLQELFDAGDLHIDDVREILGDYWRGLYYMDDPELMYYWEPLEGYAVSAYVDEDRNVTYLDLYEFE